MNQPPVPTPCPLRHPFVSPVSQMNPVTVIAGESFISTIARQRDLDVLPRKTGYEVRRQHGRVPERLLQMVGQRLDRLDEVRLKINSWWSVPNFCATKRA